VNLGVNQQADEALLLYQQICALPYAEPYNMRTLRQWIRNERQGNFSIQGRYGLENTWGDLYHPSVDVWNPYKQLKHLWTRLFWASTPEKDDLDLVATAPQNKIDGLTRWIVCDLMTSWKDWREYRKNEKPERTTDVENSSTASGASNPVVNPENWLEKVAKEDTLETWNDNVPLRITSGISTIIACLLPVVAITILSQLHGLRNLLLCLAGFAFLFAVVLIFLTQGTSSRTEIFAATAA